MEIASTLSSGRYWLVERPKQKKTVLLSAIGRSRLEFQADPLEAQKLLAVGESKRHEQLDLVEHAAWTSLSLAVMNLDEAVTKE